jgi:ABC-2 type transport system ATP-binding protein
MWDIIGELVSGGTTLLLTTQYLDEADRLADRIAVVDTGRVIAEGTSEELKSRVGGERLEATVAREDGLKEAAGVLERYAHGDGGVRVDAERRYVGTTVAGGPGLLAAVVRNFDAAGVQVDELGLHRPTLDDVFLTMTCSSPSRTPRRSPTLQRTSGPSTTSRSHERGDE